MSKNVVSINNFSKALQDIITDYTDDVQEVVNTATEKYTTKALKEVKASSPVRTGDYKKGWRKRVERGRTSAQGVVYNATDYSIVHLLEFGHAIVTGGRVIGTVQGKKHVEPVNEEIAKSFILEVMSKL